MDNIIHQVYRYFRRNPKNVFNGNNMNWRDIKKELDRMNIKSMIVSIPISYKSRLIFPFIVKQKSRNSYKLIEELTSKGLRYGNYFLSFKEFEKDYSKEFMLLEKANFIPYDSNIVQAFVQQNRVFITMLTLFISIGFVLFTSTLNLYNLLIPILGLLLCIYIKVKETNGKITSPFCINKGIFSCDKTQAYDFLGIPFQSLGIAYFLGYMLSQLGNKLTYLDLGISFVGLIFCIYSIVIQVFKEKRLCPLCLLVIFTFFANFIYQYNNFQWSSSILIKEEVLSILAYLISVFLVLLYIENNDKDYKELARGFNSVMGEWNIISSLRRPVHFETVDSNIVLGNLKGEKIISLYIHTACKHCPDALREVLNLIIVDERYSVHLFIRSNNKEIDNYYFNEIKLAAESKRYEDIYRLYLNWKNGNNIIKNKIEDVSEFKNHSVILENSGVEYYPTIIMNQFEISNFSRFDNIKVALMNG